MNTIFDNPGYENQMIQFRSTAMSTEGMVASSHALASLSGLKILMSGGNAFDASIATNATLNVTQPHLCGIGGDAFYLIYSAKVGRVEFLNASGMSSRNANIDYFLRKGLRAIPNSGIWAAINVPGCVAGWFAILEKYGTIPASRLFHDAIHYSEEGFPISHQLCSSITSASRMFQSEKEWLKIFNPNGSIPGPGDLLRQPDLAWSLREISESGVASFYRGKIAERIVSSMEMHEGLIDQEDLAGCQAEWGKPLSTDYRGFKIYETSDNSQAVTALIAFKILSNFNVSELSEAEYLRVMLECCRTAYEFRNRYITDPREMKVKPENLLEANESESQAERIRKMIQNGKQETLVDGSIQKEDGDTTYYCVADKEGNCVSCIQSLYYGFGSGFVPERTGIVLQNRGSYFSLDKNHHNSLKPRKRTFHTLCASITTRDGTPYLLFGSMGGDVQPQIHQQVISSILDFQEDVQLAIEKPRWAIPGTIYENEETVHVENRFPTDLVQSLKRSGYKIKIEDGLSPLMGHAQGIILRDDGVKLGGADPRGDGIAVGY